MSEDLKLPFDVKGLKPITYVLLTGKPVEVPGQVLVNTLYELEQKFVQSGCRELSAAGGAKYPYKRNVPPVTGHTTRD